MQYMFYILQSENIRHLDIYLDGHYSFGLWNPRTFASVPRARARASFFVWSVMHYLKLFKSPDYSVFVVYHEKRVIHFTAVLPKYFRTPFMAEGDLQIGPCWTCHEYRRKGIASCMIHRILQSHKKPNRKFWYIVREENSASKQFAEKAGFTLYGIGVRRKRFGIRAIGSFSIEHHT